MDELSREEMGARIAGLENQVALDRALIDELRAAAAVDRDQIEKLLFDAVLGQEKLAQLTAAGSVDQAQLQALLAAAGFDHHQIEDLNRIHAADVDENDQLKEIMESCRVIGAAVGVVIERYGLDRETAFLYLARVSRTHNRELRDVAAEIAVPD